MEDISVSVVDLDKFWPSYLLWSEGKSFPAVHRDNVEEVIVCRKAGTLIYSCFVWNTNSKMCLIGIPLGNPNVSSDFRRGGLTELFKGMELILKERGYTKIWTTSNTWSVMRSLDKRGFIKADPNVHVYIKML